MQCRGGRMAPLKVFGQPVSTDVARVLTCLFEKELKFQLVRVDAFKGEHKAPEFLKLQDPSGQVTFKDGEKTIIDSREICRYVCDKYPHQGNKNLAGTGVLEKASIEQWLHAEAMNFEPFSSNLVFQLAFATDMGMKPDEALIKHCEKKLSNMLDIYDRRLRENEYLVGSEFTLADLSHIPNAHYLITKSERGCELFAKRKNVDRWVTAISARPSWGKVVELQRERPGPLQKIAM